jgi:hypothetical protein
MNTFNYLLFTDEQSTNVTNRFAHTTNLEDFVSTRVPSNTKQKVKWAVKIFTDWHEHWKCLLDGGIKVYKEFDEMNINEMDFCFKYFFADVRKVSSEFYPPRTLKGIAAALQHHINYTRKIPKSIFKDPEFLATRESLDAAMKLSAQRGSVKPTKRAATVTYNIEAEMWENGTFGVSNPQQLIDSLIYHLGLHLALRARQEHRDLIYGDGSQLELQRCPDDSERLKYVERVSKSNDYVIKHCNREPKITYIYENKQYPHKCVIGLYKKYISHR